MSTYPRLEARDKQMSKRASADYQKMQQSPLADTPMERYCPTGELMLSVIVGKFLVLRGPAVVGWWVKARNGFVAVVVEWWCGDQSGC